MYQQFYSKQSSKYKLYQIQLSQIKTIKYTMSNPFIDATFNNKYSNINLHNYRKKQKNYPYYNNLSKSSTHFPKPIPNLFQPNSRLANSYVPNQDYNYINQDNFNILQQDENNDQQSIFNQDLIILLKQENTNINRMKQRIQRQKHRLQTDFTNFQKQISHILQDLKTSLKAQLDNVYRIFMQKYSYMKTQVQQIMVLKKHIISNSINNNPNQFLSFQNYSNPELVKDIERQVFNKKDEKISKYIQKFQKEKLSPLQDLTDQLLSILSFSGQYYNHNKMQKAFSQVKYNFNHLINHFYQNKSDYIKSNLSNFQIIQKKIINSTVSQPKNQSLSMDKYQSQPQQNKISNIITTSKQILLTKTYFNSLNLKFYSTIKPDHSKRILCGINIQNLYLATGGMDATLNVTTISGTRIASLKGHNSNICTLALIQNNQQIYLASGGDIGCNQIIIWDIKNWSIKVTLRDHSAAVTAIVDLGDGQTIVSGSYDKKINLFNFKQQKKIMTYTNQKSAIISIVLNSSKDKLVSCGLDSTIYVWNIVRNANRVVQIEVINMIKNNFPICALNTCYFANNIVYIGTKDGKIKIYNIQSNSFQKTINIGDQPILDILVIQHQQNKNQAVLITANNKDNWLCVTRTDSGYSQRLNVNNKLDIQFGCGIGPKLFFLQVQRRLMIGMIDQNNEKKELNMFQMILY